MKKFFVVAVMCLTGLAQAQAPASPAPTPGTPAKKELVSKVLSLQQKGIEQMAQQWAELPALRLMQQASLVLQTRIAPEKREATAKLIQQELNKYVADVVPLVRSQAVKLAPSTIGALMEEKFTEDELKQLITIMESPVNRKMMQLTGEIQKSLQEKLVAQNRFSVDPKIKALEQAIAKHLGLPAAPAAPVGAASGAKTGAPKN